LSCREDFNSLLLKHEKEVRYSSIFFIFLAHKPINTLQQNWDVPQKRPIFFYPNFTFFTINIIF